MNPDAYDPHYHYDLAIEAGLNAYAAPLGMIEAGADSFAGQIPTILKISSCIIYIIFKKSITYVFKNLIIFDIAVLLIFLLFPEASLVQIFDNVSFS